MSRWYILNDTVTSTPIVRKTDHFGRGQRPDAVKHAPREDDDQGRASSAERKLIARHLWSVTVSCTCRVDYNVRNCNVRHTTFTYLFHLVVTCYNNTNYRTFAGFKAHQLYRHGLVRVQRRETCHHKYGDRAEYHHELTRYPALREDRSSLFIFTLCVADLTVGCTAISSSFLKLRHLKNIRVILK